MSPTAKKMHELEDQLIQISGLMQALIKILPDGNDYVCIANELERRLSEFQENFEDSWGNFID